jgi:hypothetical protein
MAAISVVEAIGAGFSVIRHRPVSVLVWGGLRMALVVATLAVMAPMFLYLFSHLAELAQQGNAARPNFTEFVKFQAVSRLMSLAGTVVGVILYCAVTRSVLFPEARKYAYLRLGMAELWMLLWMIGGGIVAAVVIVLAAIMIAIVAGLAALAHAGAAGILFAIAAGIAGFVCLIYVALRLAMVGPMTVRDGRFHLTDVWALGRGHVVDFFVILLGVFLILIVADVVIGGLAVAFGANLLSQAVGGFDHIDAYFRQSPDVVVPNLLRTFAPLLAVGAVLAIPLSGCFLAIVGAPWARAYRDIMGPEAAVASF